MKSLSLILFAAFSASCIAEDLKAKDAYKIFVERKGYERGVIAFEQEIAAHPGDPALLTGLGQLHYSFLKYDEAKLALERALVIEPTNAAAHNFLGIVHSQRGREPEALKELDLAIKSDPNYADAHFNRA